MEMEWFFQTNLKIIHWKCPEALLFKQDENGTIICFYMLQPPHVHITPYDMLVSGFCLLPFRVGLKISSYFLKIMEWFDKKEHEIMGGRKYYLLQRMCVNVLHQGDFLKKILNSEF
jgi:hypothetical protein